MKTTINDILAKRDATLAEIRKSSDKIKKQTHALFSPPISHGRMEAVMNNVDRAVAIYDGVMFGVKVMRRLRRTFLRK